MALFQRGHTWWYEFRYRGRRYRRSRRHAVKNAGARDRAQTPNGSRGGRQRDPSPPRRRDPVLGRVGRLARPETPAWAPKTTSAATLDVAHLKRHLGGQLLIDIDVQTVGEYVVARRAARAAEKTIRNELGTLRGILRHYAQLKDVGITLPGQRDVEYGVALASEEEHRLIVACAASRWRSLYPAVALATGLRHDELRLLRWSSMDFANEAIRVGQSKTAHGDGRAVPLNQRALVALHEWPQQFPARKPSHFGFASERVGFAGDEEVPTVFDVDPTKPIGSWKVAWTAARRVAGVTCRWHDMRHTTVTRFLERGVPFAVVATIMGWSPASAVRMAKRYGHTSANHRSVTRCGSSIRSHRRLTRRARPRPPPRECTSRGAVRGESPQFRPHCGSRSSRPARIVIAWWLLGLDSNQQPSG
jgi:integrase